MNDQLRRQDSTKAQQIRSQIKRRFVSTAAYVVNSKRKAKYGQSKKATSKTTTTTTAKQNKNKVTLLAPRALQHFLSRLPEAILSKVRWSEWG